MPPLLRGPLRGAQAKQVCTCPIASVGRREGVGGAGRSVEAWPASRVLLGLVALGFLSGVLLRLDIVGHLSERGHLVAEVSEAVAKRVALRLHLTADLHGVVQCLLKPLAILLQALILLQKRDILGLHLLQILLGFKLQGSCLVDVAA